MAELNSPVPASGTDWLRWHDSYRTSAAMRWRLRSVQSYIADCLDQAPPGRVCVSSICAGDGRDLLPVLRRHPRRADVQATLVENHPTLAARAGRAIAAAGLTDHARVLCANATDPDTWRPVASAQVVLLCGVLGNVRDGDLPRLFANLAALCDRRSRLIWTRGLRTLSPPTLSRIIDGFSTARFELCRLRVRHRAQHLVGLHRYNGTPTALPVDGALFVFTGPLPQTGRCGQRA